MSRHQSHQVPQVRTLVSPWSIDHDGTLSREIGAVALDDADAADRASDGSGIIDPADRTHPAGSERVALLRVDQAYKRMLTSIERASLTNIPDLLDIRDKAAALGLFARLARPEAERQTAEIRLRAERRCGEILRALPRGRSDRAQISGRWISSKTLTKKAHLAAVNVSRKQSRLWEKLAQIPSDVFEKILVSSEVLSTRGVLAAWRPSRTTTATAATDPALRLWRRLVAFDDGMLDQDPRELLGSLTPAMRGTVYALAPKIAAWLDRVPPQAATRKVATAAVQVENGQSR